MLEAHNETIKDLFISSQIYNWPNEDVEDERIIMPMKFQLHNPLVSLHIKLLVWSVFGH